MKTYFDTAVRENRYYSEDWTFCENWRDLGGKIWVDKRVLLKHTGTYVFDYAAQDKLYQDLHAMAQANQAPVDRGAPTTATPAATPGTAVEAAVAQAGEAVIAQAAAAAPAPAPVQGQVKASSKKSKK
jgi:hypothetical protein